MPCENAALTVVGRDADASGQALHLGAYRARDGATGGPVLLDGERPHAVSVVGKRGSGKSHTLGVLAEGLVAADGVAPIIVDPMGEFGAIAEHADGTTPAPRVRANALPPRAWCDLLDLDPASPAGALVWRAASETTTLDAMTAHVADATADRPTRRAATNHLELARDWSVFSPDGHTATTLLEDSPAVLDCSRLPEPAANAVCRAIATDAYRARSTDTQRARSTDETDDSGNTNGHDPNDLTDPFPWLLVDEAHVFFDGVAAPALTTLLTRGRTPGVSLVAATQRPSALPDVALSQSDLTIAHRLTNGHDRDALAHAHPTRDVTDALPDRTGDALLLDDATDTTHHVHVRDRHTPHHGATPRATEASNDHLSHRDH